MKTALLRQKELKEEENGREHSVNTLLEDQVAIRGMDETYKCKAEQKK